MIYIKNKRFHLKAYVHTNGSEPITDWIQTLDNAIQARIDIRIARFESGSFGDYKAVGDGVYEARLFFGPGYRVYFAFVGDEIVLLLMGGDKSTQDKDIKRAQEFLKIYRERL